MENHVNKKLVPLEKVKTLYNIKYYYILSFLLPSLIFSLVLYFNDVYPINSNGNMSILIIDFWDQYYPFIHEFTYRLRSGGSLLWSWNLGGGFNYLFHYAYYLTSPFNILASFFPSSILREVLTIFVIIKIGLAGLFMAVYLKYVNKKADILLPVFASFYALSGWALAFYHNIMWLDVYYIAPLALLGVHRLVVEKKRKLYIFSLTFALFLNFHIAFMLCLFIILYFLAMSIINYTDIKKLLSGVLEIFFCTLIAIGLIAWLLVPAFSGMQNMYRNNFTGLPQSNWIHDMPVFLSGLTAFSQQPMYHYRGGGPANIYSGMLNLILLCFFALSSRVKIKERFIYISILVLLLISLNHNVLHFIWHGLSFTFGFPGRFSFLFTFLLIAMSYRGYIETIKSNTLPKRNLILMVIMPLLIIVTSHSSWQEYDRVAWNYYLILIYFLAFSYLYFIKKKKNLYLINIFKYILIFIACMEMFITSHASIYSWRSNWSPLSLHDNVREVASHRSSGYFRTEFNRQWHANYVFTSAYSNFNQIAIFSSSANGDTGRFMRDMGLPTNLFASRYLYFETSPLSNAFLNIRYLIERENSPAGDNYFFERVYQIDDVVLLRNKFYLPLAFMANRELSQWQGDSSNLFESQNELFRSATGIQENLFQIFNAVADSEDGIYVFDLAMPQEGDLFVFSTLGSQINLYEYPDFIRNISTTYPAIHHLGSFENNAHVRLMLRLNEPRGEQMIQVALINRDVFTYGHQLLNQNTLNITNFSDTNIRGTIDVESEGLLYTSIPFDNGNWQVYVNGMRTEIVLINGAMIGIELESGLYEIEFRYVNTAFGVGLIISVSSLIICLGLAMRNVMKRMLKRIK